MHKSIIFCLLQQLWHFQKCWLNHDLKYIFTLLVLLLCLWVIDFTVLLYFRFSANLDYPLEHVSDWVEVGSFTVNTLGQSVLTVSYCCYFVMVLLIENCLITCSKSIEGEKVLPAGLLLPVFFLVHFFVFSLSCEGGSMNILNISNILIHLLQFKGHSN